jgi:hypothetical protein
MATRLSHRPATLAGTLSFYVSASDSGTLAVVNVLADAVTVKGPAGPATIRRLRGSGWNTPVIFDRNGYDPRVSPVDTEQWFDEQAAAGADRLLTPGTWLAWEGGAETLERAVDIEAERCSRHPDATAVFAIDHRWLTKSPMDLANALNGLGRTTALVLAHPTDPLSPNNAVQGLVALTRSVEALSILRTDHGGLGALVYGAQHAAVGLIGSHRHFVPPNKTGGGKTDDRSARVFVRDLMDWFTGATIAGWVTERVNLRCHLGCCRGRSLARFFDPQYDGEAVVHNRLALSRLADEILDAPMEERRRRFSQVCLDAVELYGPMGKLSMVTEAKSQLNQWTFT